MNHFFRTLLFFTLGLLIAACVKEPLPTPMEPEPDLSLNEAVGTGAFQIWLTDSPTDLAEVNVEILEVQIQACQIEDDDDYDDLKCEWLSLNTNQGVYNLLDLQDGVDTLLAEIDSLPFDLVREIRLVLGTDNFVVTNDGDTIRLRTPSGGASGLKIKACIDLSMEVDVFEVLLDFDAHKSIKELGNGDYLLKPVIKLMDPDRYCVDDRDDDDEEDDNLEQDLPDAVRETIRGTLEDVDEIYFATDCDSTEGFLVYGEVPFEDDDEEDALAFISNDGELLGLALEIDEDDLPEAVKEKLEQLENEGYDLEDDDLFQVKDSLFTFFWGIAESDRDEQLFWLAIDDQGQVLCKTPLTYQNEDGKDDDGKDDDEDDDGKDDDEDDDGKDDDEDDDEEDDEDEDDEDEDDFTPIKDLPEAVKKIILETFVDVDYSVFAASDCNGNEGYFVWGEIKTQKGDQEDALAFVSTDGELIDIALEMDEDDLPEGVKETLDSEEIDLEDDDLFLVRDATLYWAIGERDNDDEDAYFIFVIDESGDILCEIPLD